MTPDRFAIQRLATGEYLTPVGWQRDHRYARRFDSRGVALAVLGELPGAPLAVVARLPRSNARCG